MRLKGINESVLDIWSWCKQDPAVGAWKKNAGGVVDVGSHSVLAFHLVSIFHLYNDLTRPIMRGRGELFVATLELVMSHLPREIELTKFSLQF